MHGVGVGFSLGKFPSQGKHCIARSGKYAKVYSCLGKGPRQLINMRILL